MRRKYCKPCNRYANTLRRCPCSSPAFPMVAVFIAISTSAYNLHSSRGLHSSVMMYTVLPDMPLLLTRPYRNHVAWTLPFCANYHHEMLYCCFPVKPGCSMLSATFYYSTHMHAGTATAVGASPVYISGQQPVQPKPKASWQLQTANCCGRSWGGRCWQQQLR